MDKIIKYGRGDDAIYKVCKVEVVNNVEIIKSFINA